MHSFKLVCCTCPCTRSGSLSVFLLTSALLQNRFVVLPYQNVLIHDWLVLPARWTTCCRTRTTVWCSARTATAPTSRVVACTSRPCTKRQVCNNLLDQTSSSFHAQPPHQVPSVVRSIDVCRSSMLCLAISANDSSLSCERTELFMYSCKTASVAAITFMFGVSLFPIIVRSPTHDGMI